MIPLSQTVPHFVHTLSALELSLSISAEPQFWHLSAGILKLLSLLPAQNKNNFPGEIRGFEPPQV